MRQVRAASSYRRPSGGYRSLANLASVTRTGFAIAAQQQHTAGAGATTLRGPRVVNGKRREGAKIVTTGRVALFISARFSYMHIYIYMRYTDNAPHDTLALTRYIPKYFLTYDPFSAKYFFRLVLRPHSGNYYYSIFFEILMKICSEFSKILGTHIWTICEDVCVCFSVIRKVTHRKLASIFLFCFFSSHPYYFLGLSFCSSV